MLLCVDRCGFCPLSILWAGPFNDRNNPSSIYLCSTHTRVDGRQWPPEHNIEFPLYIGFSVVFVVYTCIQGPVCKHVVL